MIFKAPNTKNCIGHWMECKISMIPEFLWLIGENNEDADIWTCNRAIFTFIHSYCKYAPIKTTNKPKLTQINTHTGSFQMGCDLVSTCMRLIQSNMKKRENIIRHSGQIESRQNDVSWTNKENQLSCVPKIIQHIDYTFDDNGD